uniref:Uncharacterized protein n=1 Tax=Percolomonas cosmopolitus TaxID=63605 RepID=A0A7S1KRH0_9EUKA
MFPTNEKLQEWATTLHLSSNLGQFRLKVRMERQKMLRDKRRVTQRMRKEQKEILNAFLMNQLKVGGIVHRDAEGKTQSLHISRSQIQELIDQTGLSSKRILGYLQYHFDERMHPNRLGTQEMAHIDRILKKKRTLSSSDVTKLVEELMVSRTKILYYLWKCVKGVKSKFTKEAQGWIHRQLMQGGITSWDEWKIWESKESVIESMRLNFSLSRKQVMYAAWKVLKPNTLKITRSLELRILKETKALEYLSNRAEFLRLLQDFGLSPPQARYLFSKLNRKRKKLRWTAEKKEIIQQYLKDLERTSQTQIDYHHLAQEVGMFPQQVYVVVQHLRNMENFGPLTQEKKKRLLSDYSRWHGSMRSFMRQPLEAPNTMESTYQMSLNQIYSVLLSANRGNITKQIKGFLYEWLQEHDWRSPDKEEFESLLAKTQLARKQLLNLILLLKDQPGEITLQKKLTIAALLAHRNNKLNKEDLDHLQIVTKLSRQQIHSICHIHREAQQKSSMEKPQNWKSQKVTIREWIRERGHTKPTSQDLDKLQHLVKPMLRTQMNYYVRKYRKEAQEREDTE